MLSFRSVFATNSLFFRSFRAIFIQTKQTPNPDFLKFIANGQVFMETGTMDFVAARYTHVSPLARKLFAIDGVKRVFYGPDYISIAKKEEFEWSVSSFLLSFVQSLLIYRVFP